MSTEIIRRSTVEELCGHRAAAIAKWAEALTAIEAARAAHERASPHYPIQSMPSINGYKQPTELLDSIKLDIDRDVWRSLLKGSQLESLMDQEERAKFERIIQDGYSEEKHPTERDRWGEPVKIRVPLPEATIDNLYATFSRLAGEADMIFRRGLVNAFKQLSRDYRSNDGFKLGDRIVIEWAVSYDKTWHFRTRTDTERQFLDIDRVLHVLDGKKPPEWGDPGLRSGLYGATHSWKEGDPTTFESDYWECRFFKKGTIHLWCKRKDLIDRANKIIAEHYGETLAGPPGARSYTPQTGEPVATKIAEDVLDVLRRCTTDGQEIKLPSGERLERNLYVRVNNALEAMGGTWDRRRGAHVFHHDTNASDQLEAMLATGELVRPQDLGQFDTPPELAERVIAHACIDVGDRVLEPSAGLGNLVAEIEAKGASVMAVEPDAGRMAKLRQRAMLEIGATQADFLTVQHHGQQFDRVVMNPPFAKSADVNHVLHAWDFLRDGGRLVAIMSAGAPTRRGQAADALRELVERNSGQFLPLPEGAFKSAGTMVRTALLILDKIA